MAARGDSYSVGKKARTYRAAVLEYAVDGKAITDNAARKLELPTQFLGNLRVLARRTFRSTGVFVTFKRNVGIEA